MCSNTHSIPDSSWWWVNVCMFTEESEVRKGRWLRRWRMWSFAGWRRRGLRSWSDWSRTHKRSTGTVHMLSWIISYRRLTVTITVPLGNWGEKLNSSRQVIWTPNLRSYGRKLHGKNHYTSCYKYTTFKGIVPRKIVIYVMY